MGELSEHMSNLIRHANEIVHTSRIVIALERMNQRKGPTKEEKQTLLSIYCVDWLGGLYMVRSLVEMGANVNEILNYKGDTLLIRAIRDDKWPIVNYLLDQGCDTSLVADAPEEWILSARKHFRVTAWDCAVISCRHSNSDSQKILIALAAKQADQYRCLVEAIHPHWHAAKVLAPYAVLVTLCGPCFVPRLLTRSNVWLPKELFRILKSYLVDVL